MRRTKLLNHERNRSKSILLAALPIFLCCCAESTTESAHSDEEKILNVADFMIIMGEREHKIATNSAGYTLYDYVDTTYWRFEKSKTQFSLFKCSDSADAISFQDSCDTKLTGILEPYLIGKSGAIGLWRLTPNSSWISNRKIIHADSVNKYCMDEGRGGFSDGARAFFSIECGSGNNKVEELTSWSLEMKLDSDDSSLGIFYINAKK